MPILQHISFTLELSRTRGYIAFYEKNNKLARAQPIPKRIFQPAKAGEDAKKQYLVIERVDVTKLDIIKIWKDTENAKLVGVDILSTTADEVHCIYSRLSK